MYAKITLNITSTVQNIAPSVQVGDYVYYQAIDNSLALNTANNPILAGVIVEIDKVTGKDVIIQLATGVNSSDISGFIMFLKDKRINNSSLKGYYAEVTLINNDINSQSELFALNSEFTVSSK
tara:strand:- start:47 stop:415 length:369 start_codon:yes stop_codon:yes gene_type:complete